MSFIKLKQIVFLFLVVFLTACKTQAQATPCQEQSYALAQYSDSIKPFLSSMKARDIAFEEDGFSDGVINFRVRNLSSNGDGSGTIGWLNINTKKNSIYDQTLNPTGLVQLNVPKDKIYSFINNCTGHSLQDKTSNIRSESTTNIQSENNKYQALSLPINSEYITKCAYDMDKKIPSCRKIKFYEISIGSDLLSIARESGSPIGEQEFAWVLPTHQGVVFLSFIAEESGNKWFLIAKNSQGKAIFFDFGMNPSFVLEDNLKITAKVAYSKKKISTHHYQVELDGSIRQLD